MMIKKFKAWDKIHNKFVDDRLICLRADGEIIIIRNDGHWSTENPAHFIFLQYTGLKDKNGKEIYEGDIISWKDVNDLIHVHPVTWSSNDYVAAFNFGFSPNSNFTEIIGNIYENPELLESPNE